MLEFQLLTGAVCLFGLVLIALGQPPAPRRVRIRRDDHCPARNASRLDRW